MEVWSRWKSAILDYATSSGIKSKLLEHALRDHHSDSTGMFVFIIIFFNCNENFTYKF